MSTSISQLRAAPAADDSRTAFVLSGGGNQAVSQVGMLRALLERGIVPDVIVGHLGGRVQRRGRSRPTPTSRGVERLEETWESLARRARCSRAARSRRAWNLLTRDDHLFDNDGLRGHHRAGRHARRRSTSSQVPLGWSPPTSTPARRSCSPRGPLEPALLASTALPGLFPPIRHDGRILVDGAVVDTVPLWHALAGPVDRIYVLQRRRRRSSTARCARRSTSRSARSPSAASSGSSSSCGSVPESVEVVVLPRPIDDRELFDFSDAQELIDEAYRLADAGARRAPRPPSAGAPRRRRAAAGRRR